jgi:hypothetical protein
MPIPTTFATLLTLTLLLLMACTPAATPTPEPTPPPPHPLQGGVLAEFNVGDERFAVWVTNPETIQELADVRDGLSQATIPNGRIHRGPGQGDHNAQFSWSWHLDPEDIHMAEVTIELCDGAPHFVEEEVDYFVDTVERYCPWGAELDGMQDFR